MTPTEQLSRFQTRNQQSALDHVLNSIISAIINGEITAGDKLPTELELSQSLGVGRNSVREAVKILEAYGVVRIRRPEGTFVCDTYSQKMLDPMLYGLLLRKDNWGEFIQTRGVMEIGTLFLACHSVQPEHIETLEAIVFEMKAELGRAEPSIEKLMEHDRRFHAYIVTITGSVMILDVTEYITKISIPSRKKTIEAILTGQNTEHFLQKHMDIVDVLRKKAYGEIERVVLSHYEYWKSMM